MKISLLSTVSNDSHTNPLCKVDLSEVTFGERLIYCFVVVCLFVCFFLRLEESSHMLITIFVYYYYYYYCYYCYYYYYFYNYISAVFYLYVSVLNAFVLQ